MKIRESCSCGATFRVKGSGSVHAYAQTWRREHHCTPKAAEKPTVEAKDGGVFELGFMSDQAQDRSRP